MTAVRFLGIVASLAFFLLAVRAYGRRHISRLSMLIVAGLSSVLLLLSISPSLFDPLFALVQRRPRATSAG